MSQLMIFCPRHRRTLPTNRFIRAAEFAAADLGTNTIGPCPHCGERHTWTVAQAHLAGASPRPPAPQTEAHLAYEATR